VCAVAENHDPESTAIVPDDINHGFTLHAELCTWWKISQQLQVHRQKDNSWSIHDHDKCAADVCKDDTKVHYCHNQQPHTAITKSSECAKCFRQHLKLRRWLHGREN
jgi:hypothetical protein